MKNARSISIVLFKFLVIPFLLFINGCGTEPSPPPQALNVQLEYLKAVNISGPREDPGMVFLLMAEYLNSNQLESGINFFQSFIDKNENQMSPEQRAVYLSALGVLRASYANNVPLLERVDWVNETINIMETAREISNNNNFIVRWTTGVVYAQLPDRFEKREQAYQDLKWLINNRDKEPQPGFLREVYYQLANLYQQDNNEQEASNYLALSGYDGFDKTIMLITFLAVNAEKGGTFHPRQLREIIPGRVFALTGFEFTEYYFIVSEDGKELISIDAGTRPDSAKSAYEYLKSRYPKLPPLTTVFVTHAHWDHIGGRSFFSTLNPNIKYYSRENYHEEYDRVLEESVQYNYFFGTDFKKELVADYKPDVTISGVTDVTIGETPFQLIPIPGGETPDGIFIYMPKEAVLFVGDFIMPFIGAPFFEEGNVPGLLEAMDVLVSLNPKYVLHGHETLTRLYNPPDVIAKLRVQLDWLNVETLKAIRKGIDRSSIHQLNLIPPTLLQQPETHLQFLVLRENFINRIYDQHVGYWQWDLTGMDHLTQKEYGALLTHYFGLSEKNIISAIEKMMQSGDYELALKTSTWALTQYDSSEIKALREQTFLKLKEKYQFANPFKFFIYSELAENETPQLDLEQ
ncbi:MAG: MBL fold metallo-hydrolase [Thermodesulfobacteriota bacterium]